MFVQVKLNYAWLGLVSSGEAILCHVKSGHLRLGLVMSG